MDNGPGYEPSISLPEGLSYCVDCGNVMVFHSSRECPACYLDGRLDEIADRLDAMEDDDG